ncbi:24879_t:CDS:1, partial [Racocetra persica]
MLKNLGYENAKANPLSRPENAEADADPGPKNTVFETQNSTTEQSLNDGQDDQSICE